MPELEFITLDVFTETRYEGNPLALVKVPKGKDVSTESMQKIAREFNLSETIFVHENEVEKGVPEWKVRIFLTQREIPFAGHPTIGAAVYTLSTLAPNSPNGRLLANAGPIDLHFANGFAKASIPHNFHQHTQYLFTLQDVLELQPTLQHHLSKNEDAINVLSPVKGMSFVVVELPSLEALATITTSKKPAPRLDDEWNGGFAASYFYVFTHASPGKYALRTRMVEGSFEDPATGSAACALSCFLALGKKESAEFEITQAVEMGRKSDIGVKVTLTANGDAVERVELSGTAVQVMEGRVAY